MFARTGFLTIGLLGLGVLPTLPASAEPSATPAERQYAAHAALLTDALVAGDYSKAEKTLIEALKEQNITPDNPRAMYLASMLEVIRETGADTLTRFAAESPAQTEFLRKFMGDTEWVKLYLGCGLVPHHTDVGMRCLFDIWQAHKGVVTRKGLAVAIASVWGGGESDPETCMSKLDPREVVPHERYDFFLQREQEGKLHPNYKNLRPWELRFVVGKPRQEWGLSSLKYAGEAINIPWDKYGSACWAAGYIDPSKFGANVQGGEYNMPFADEARAETTHKNGGVCGSLSHLGCYAAMAHGIPAYTCGQPGHCAYGFRLERGNWQGGFGGPDGGMHNSIFGHSAPTSYRLMEAVFADDKTIDKAYDWSFCARAREAAGDKKGATEAWKQALSYTPLHPFFRAQLHRLMKEAGLSAEGCYGYLLKDLLPRYKGHGFAAVDATADLEDLINAMTDEQREAIYAAEQRLIAGTPASWATKCDELLAKQFDSLVSEDAKKAFLTSALASHLNEGDGTTFGQLLEWAVKTLIPQGNENMFSEAFAKAATDGNASAKTDSEEKTKKLREAYGKGIAASEAARSVPAFQALTDAALAAGMGGAKPEPLQNPAAIPGKPAGDKGMLRVTPTCNFDSPADHRAVLTLAGGASHTGKDAKPNYVAELANSATMTGCIIRKSGAAQNLSRMKKAVVYTSADGATWMKVAETADMPTEWAVPFPSGTKGKWVKVEFENAAPEFAHLSHFVVFVK